ncbi:hypothetical protein [Hugenholtzia roseola]|uniref:hypothetical protein n=1 Tax=Hugenholtzia roseola TaxID=1002 RepID=UPI0013774D2B|nr:hypothetical protein [Hugenholtzia roseola]
MKKYILPLALCFSFLGLMACEKKASPNAKYSATATSANRPMSKEDSIKQAKLFKEAAKSLGNLGGKLLFGRKYKTKN